MVFIFSPARRTPFSKLTEAVGWKYAWDEEPSNSPMPPALWWPLPKEDSLAISTASLMRRPTFEWVWWKRRKHKIGSPADYILLFCFHCDETQGKYTLAITNVMKLAAGLTFANPGRFDFYLHAETRRKSNLK